MSYNDNVRFFYENAGASWNPATETPEQGRQRGAERLAQVEAWGQRSGYWFGVGIDPDPMWDDDVERETTDYDQYIVALYSTTGERVATVGSIDIGPDVDPDWHPHIRLIKAELLFEVAPDDVEHIKIPADELAMIEHLNDTLRLSNAVDGFHAFQFGGTYGAIRDALLLALSISLSGNRYPDNSRQSLAQIRAREIAEVLTNEAVDNGENIAYQIELWNEGRIS